MTVPVRIGFAVALLGAVSACAKVQAKTPAPAPLETPEAPPRVVVPVKLPDPDPPPAAAQPAPPVAAPRPRDTSPPATPPAKPPDKPAAPETPPPPPSSDVVELEKTTLRLLAEAQRDLDRVVLANLNADARAQYDQAKRFIAQASDGLKKKYYLYALGLAEKAANLASQLPKGRLNLVMW